jgi:hypothetical protein
MNYLVKDEPLLIHYEQGKGAWTYHLKIPNTRDIRGKWGELKVSGFVDSYAISQRNLAPVKGGDKMLSINDTIRKAIQKSAGETVTVTLHLEAQPKTADQTAILDCFRDANLLHRFEALPPEEQEGTLTSILSQPNEEAQVKKILYYIEQWS